MRTLTTVVIAMLIVGCSPTYHMAKHYTGRATKVMDYKKENINGLDIYWHDDRSDLALVYPHNIITIAFWMREPGRWLAKLDVYRADYGDALLGALHEREHGKACEITAAEPYPELFAIEFQYSCAVETPQA